VRYGRDELGIANLHAGRVEDARFAPGSFDLVTLWDVLEHLRDPDPLLQHLGKLLAPGGALFLHTPNVRVQVPKARLRRLLRGMEPGGHYLEAKDHLHLYSPRTLRVLLGRNGFARVRFAHLHPIQGVVGVRPTLGRALKNAWFHVARGLHAATAGALNLDNLFVVARRGAGA
jgi:SAM-dependent methyltransferase